MYIQHPISLGFSESHITCNYCLFFRCLFNNIELVNNYVWKTLILETFKIKQHLWSHVIENNLKLYVSKKLLLHFYKNSTWYDSWLVIKTVFKLNLSSLLYKRKVSSIRFSFSWKLFSKNSTFNFLEFSLFL